MEIGDTWQDDMSGDCAWFGVLGMTIGVFTDGSPSNVDVAFTDSRILWLDCLDAGFF